MAMTPALRSSEHWRSQWHPSHQSDLLVSEPIFELERQGGRRLRRLSVLVGVDDEQVELDVGPQPLQQLARFRPGFAELDRPAAVGVRADPNIVTLGAGDGLE